MAADFTNVKVGERVITCFSIRGIPFMETAVVVKVLKKYFVVEVDKSDNKNNIGSKREYNFNGRTRGEGPYARGAGARPFDERYVQRYEAAKNRWEMMKSIEKQTDGSVLVEMTDDELLELLNLLCTLSGQIQARKLASESENQTDTVSS